MVKRVKRIRKFFRKFRLNQRFKLNQSRYSLICFIGNSGNVKNVNKEKNKLIELFCLLVKKACEILLRAMKLLGKCALILLERFANHPWISMVLAYLSCALLIFYYLSNKYGRKFTWYHYLLLMILYLSLIILLSVAIKTSAFRTILDWLKSMLVTLLLALRNLTNSLAEHSSPAKDKCDSSKTSGLQNFIVFSVLVAFMTKYLLGRFKRKLVGETPLTDILIEIIDADPLDFDHCLDYFSKSNPV